MPQFHSLPVTAVERQNRDAVVVSFGVPGELRDTFAYRQGQYLTLRTEIDGEEVRRSYSVCSAVQDEQLRVAIKRVNGGLFSNWANEQLAEGDAIEVMPPAGRFNLDLDEANDKHYVAFGAGSGITPLLSIIKTTLMSEPDSRFTLFYGNRASGSTLFRQELSDIKDRYLGRFNLVYIMSREQLDIELFNGRIDRAKVEDLLAHWIEPADIDAAFICGPLDMMEATRDVLTERGVAKDAIKMEVFAATKSAAKARSNAPVVTDATDRASVKVVIDGRTHEYDLARGQENLLDAALEQSIELPYSCKSGVCSTCRCKLVEGEVDMDTNFALEDYEVERGFILSCQSFPVTDHIVIDFDAET